TPRGGAQRDRPAARVPAQGAPRPRAGAAGAIGVRFDVGGSVPGSGVGGLGRRAGALPRAGPRGRLAELPPRGEPPDRRLPRLPPPAARRPAGGPALGDRLARGPAAVP